MRSIGTVAAVELRADDAGYSSRLRPKLYEFFLNAGILLRPLGNMIYVLPPYCITADELALRVRSHRRIARSLRSLGRASSRANRILKFFFASHIHRHHRCAARVLSC